MPLSREQVYNELNGSEAKEILLQRFAAQLNAIPWLQRHITLPRVHMRMSVTFSLYADQPTPELHSVDDDFTIRTDTPVNSSGGSSSALTSHPHILEPHDYKLEEDIDASPSGSPPDQIRDEHSIPIPTPIKNRMVKVTEDFLAESQLSEGVTIKRLRGDHPSPSGGATIVTQDFGSRVNRREEQLPKFKNSARDHNQLPLPKPPERERN